MLQIREEFGFTKGRIIVRGKLVSRGQGKRADYVLNFKPSIRLALIEAKDRHSQDAWHHAVKVRVAFARCSKGYTLALGSLLTERLPTLTCGFGTPLAAVVAHGLWHGEPAQRNHHRQPNKMAQKEGIAGGQKNQGVVRQVLLPALRNLGGDEGNCEGGLMTRPRRLECHAPVQLTVGTTVNLRRAAEVEIRMPRFADRPAAIILLKVEKLLWF